MIITLRTNSTPNGVHSTVAWLKCPRKAWLDDLARDTKTPTGKLSGTAAFDVGTIVHGILAAHYSSKNPDRIDTRHFVYRLDSGPDLDRDAHREDIALAETLYRAYRVFWRGADFTKVLDVEIEIEIDTGLGFKLSGGLDLVVKATKRELKKMGIDGETGIYIPDHKTRTRNDPAEFELACHDAQFASYPVLARAKYGNEVKGIIVNRLFKSGVFDRFHVPLMATDTEWRSVTLPSLKIANAKKLTSLAAAASSGLPEANTSQCFSWKGGGWDFCRHYRSGACDRRNRI